MPPQGSDNPEIISVPNQPIDNTQNSSINLPPGNIQKQGRHKSRYLVIFAISLITLAIIGLIVFLLFYLNKPSNKSTYDTDCYKITIPKFYKVTKSSNNCSFKAALGQDYLNSFAVDDSATTSNALFNSQKDKIFGTSKNGYFSNSSESEIKIDGQSTHLYSFETIAKQAVHAYFVHTDKIYGVSGIPIQNFIIIQQESTSSLAAIFQPKINIPDSIKWKPANYIDATQFNNFGVQARTAWQLKDYMGLLQLSNTELSLAKTDKEKSGAYYWRGVAENGMGQAAQSEADERLAISLDSSSVGPLVTLGGVLIGKGDFTNAMIYAQKAIALDPTYSWAYNLRGLVYLDTGNKEAGIVDLKKAIQLEPTQAVFQQNLNTAQR